MVVEPTLTVTVVPPWVVSVKVFVPTVATVPNAAGGVPPKPCQEGAPGVEVQALLDNLIDRGLDPKVCRLFIVDGAKALRKAILRTFGKHTPIQRCQIHKGRNIMEPSIAAAKAGVTTGEWGAVLRETFGEYRAPTGVGRAARQEAGGLDPVRAEVERVSRKIGRRIKFLVGKPGLDGHSNGAEQIAVRARDAGMEVVYEGIRLTPAEIVNAALEEGVHCIGLSILSGSHVQLVRDVLARMRSEGLGDIPLVVGGIIPPDDEALLRKEGVAAVYTPKDYELNSIMADVVRIVEKAATG